MTGPHEDPRLHDLLSDAVSDVEPQDRLASLRNRTKVTPMSSRRPWILGAGGAVVATAAVIGAIAYAGGNLGNDADPPAPAAQGSSSPGDDTSEGATTDDGPTDSKPTGGPEKEGGASNAAPDSIPPEPDAGALPVYYLGDTPQGPRLFREFHSSSAPAGEALVAALDDAASGDPLDSDYRSAWPTGERVVNSATDDGDLIRIELASESFRTKPAGLSTRDASLAVQQLVYTAQGVVQKRSPVQFEVDGAPVDRVLGVPTTGPVKNGSVRETLSQMSITSPVEGATVSGTFTATGASNGFEANVQWQVLKGDKVVRKGFTTAGGWMADKLFPWKVKVDVSGLAPGDYVFRAHNDDPSGGAEGSGPHTDTKRITVE